VPDKLGTSHAKSHWRSRAFNAAHAPRQRLPQALCAGSSRHLRSSGFHGVEPPFSQDGLLDFFESLTGSFGSRQNVTPWRDSSDRVTFLTRRSLAKTVGHLNAADTGGSHSHARKKRGEANSVFVPLREPVLIEPTRHPIDPCNISSVSSSGTSENKLQMLPPRGGRMPSASIVPPGSWPFHPPRVRRPVRRSRHPAAICPS